MTKGKPTRVSVSPLPAQVESVQTLTTHRHIFAATTSPSDLCSWILTVLSYHVTTCVHKKSWKCLNSSSFHIQVKVITKGLKGVLYPLTEGKAMANVA